MNVHLRKSTDVCWVEGWWRGSERMQRKKKKEPKAFSRFLKERRLCIWAIRDIFQNQNTAKLGKRSCLKFPFSSIRRKEKIISLTLPWLCRNTYEILILKLCFQAPCMLPLYKLVYITGKFFLVSASIPGLNWFTGGSWCLRLLKRLNWTKFQEFYSTSYLHSLAKLLSKYFL